MFYTSLYFISLCETKNNFYYDKLYLKYTSNKIIHFIYLFLTYLIHNYYVNISTTIFSIYFDYLLTITRKYLIYIIMYNINITVILDSTAHFIYFWNIFNSSSSFFLKLYFSFFSYSKIL